MMYRLVVQAARVLGVVHIYRRRAVIRWKEFFDFPIIGLGADAEFEVFLSD